MDQKVIKKIQGRLIVDKTTEVVGDKARVPNVQWEDAEKVDAFFSFATNLGIKVIYLAEGEEYNEETGLTRPSILQVGFLHQGIMHHINLVDEDEEDLEEDETDVEENSHF